MLAAARKHRRVVQVNMQRRSTPHLVEARDRIIREGKLGTHRTGRDLLLLPHAGPGNPPDTAPPADLDYDMWTGPAPMRPYNPLVHPRGWRAFMEYGNGIIGDMCVHMFDMVRWMLDLGWPKRDRLHRRHPASRRTARPTSPTRRPPPSTSATWIVVWQHRTWGHAPDPEYPWGATFYGDKGTLKASVFRYDFTPLGPGKPVHADVTYEFEQYPEDRTEKDLERHVAPAIRRHLPELPGGGRHARPAGGRHRAGLHLHRQLHPGEHGHEARPHAGLGPRRQAVVGDEEANRLLRRPYRRPWVHPEPEPV